MPNPPRYTGRVNGAYQTTPTRNRSPRETTITEIRNSYQTHERFSWNSFVDWYREYERQVSLLRQPPQQEDLHMFNIGDSVYYYSEIRKYKFYGIIQKIEIDGITVLYEEGFAEAYGVSPLYKMRSFNLTLGSKEPPLSIEQQVSNKCKKLWNNSNYVKRNPSYAY